MPAGRPFISGLLLAAGSSSRFGGVKQLAELGGRTLAERAVSTLSASGLDEVVVVIGHAAPEVRGELARSGARLVLNPEFRSGLSSSLRAGVASLDPRSSAVVVCLADQPFVTSELVGRVVSKFLETGADAVAASAGGVVTPPVLFSRRLYAKVEELRGDKGAKAVVIAEPGLELVAVDPDALLDVDTAAEMDRARELLEKGTRERARAAGGPSPRRPSSKK